MSLKEKIQTDFMTALKAKDEVAKSAISGIKAKITEAEKANGNTELTDPEIIKVLSKAIKQREESEKIYAGAGRTELAQQEASEACVLRNYMPAQMSEEDIEKVCREIVSNLPGISTNKNALIGKTMGEFNKRFQGQADGATVKSIIEKIAG